MKRLILFAIFGCLGLGLAAGSHGLASMSPNGPWYAPDPAGASRSETYRSGQRALDERSWGEAVELFNLAIAEGGADLDASMYWKAYALVKQGRSAEAAQTLTELQRTYPDSSWIDDAKALELEADGHKSESSGLVPSDLEDDELKLYALNSLMNVESERAIPILSEFLRGDHPQKLKERALFVLSQSDSPQALEILSNVAQGRQNPELALKAVEYLGFFDDSQSARMLQEIYNSTSDPKVKSKVLEGLMIAEAKGELLAVARTEPEDRLRRKAIEMLGVVEASAELRELYSQESSVDIKRKILEAFFMADDKDALVDAYRSETDDSLKRKAIEGLGLIEATAELREIYAAGSSVDVKSKILEAYFLADDAEALIQVARTETDESLRRKAIESLGLVDSRESAEALETLYSESRDADEKKGIMEAFFIQDNPEPLIEILRSEGDRELRKKAREYLSLMDSPEASDYLLGLLEEKG